MTVDAIAVAASRPDVLGSVAGKRARVLEALRAAAPAPARLAVAFSGGVDSTLLLALAAEALGPDRVLAVTARSESLAEDERGACERLAGALGVRLLFIETRELARAGYRQNGPDRCYHCKTELFELIDRDVLAQQGCAAVAYGVTADDLGDHRPGMRAAAEHRVLGPLADAGLGKAEIRALSRELGLETWDKPAQPCLASRIPYGQAVTPEKLSRIDRAEAAVRALGFRELRVRHHGEAPELIARVEVPSADIDRLVAARADVVRALEPLGFQFVVVDLEGFRSGRLNGALRKLPVAAGSRGESA